MSQPDPTKPSIQKNISVEDNFYHIIRDNGENFLFQYLLKVKWDVPKFPSVIKGDKPEDPEKRPKSYRYMPDYLKPYLQKFNNDIALLNLAFQEYIKDYTNNILSNIKTDFEKIDNALIKGSIANIHIVFKDYFKEKIQYLFINELFNIQYNTLKTLLTNINKNKPPVPRPPRQKKPKKESKKKEKETKKKESGDAPSFILDIKPRKEKKVKEKKEKKKKPREKREKKKKLLDLKYFSTSLNFKGSLLKYFENTDVSFKILFPILNNHKEFGITFAQINSLEREYFDTSINKQKQILKTSTDDKEISLAEKEKETLENKKINYLEIRDQTFKENYRSFIGELLNNIESNALKHTKKLLKSVYKYERNNLVKYGEKTGLFG